MLDALHALSVWWDALYNRVIIPGVPGYLVISVQRILIAAAAWQMLGALYRYVQAAIPPPHTSENMRYWAQWWLYLRLREYPLLKVGAVAVSVLMVLQIPAGAGGALGAATFYLMLVYPALWLFLVGVAQFLNSLTERIKHPRE